MKRIIDELQAKGIGRRGGIKSGFKCFFLDTRRPVRDKPTIERITKLAIPPAWQSVAINRSATHQVQAVGRDAKDRWQYRYHTDFRARMDRTKFRQMKQFAARLPVMRKTLTSHLRQKGLTRERVLATTVRVLDTGMIRIGGEESVRDSHHYGLSTVDLRGVLVPEPEAVVRWSRGHHPAERATLRLLDKHGYA